jgi:hypothetical protein
MSCEMHKILRFHVKCLARIMALLVGITSSKQKGFSKNSSVLEIAGGSYVNNKDKFPWLAFIRISFPHYTWRIWNPATDLERYGFYN